MSNPGDHSFYYDPATGQYDPPRTEMSDLDRLHAKENEIARLSTALVRIQGVLRPADNAANVETVGRAMEIISALTSWPQEAIDEEMIERVRDDYDWASSLSRPHQPTPETK